MRRVALAALLLAAAGCVYSDPGSELLPDRAARVHLESSTAHAAWPVAYRRVAEFVIENGTAEPVETLLFDLSGKGHPREVVEATITDPPGRNCYILAAPRPDWPLRARLGDPGTVLLAPGESLTLLVRVSGSPGASTAVVTIPGRE